MAVGYDALALIPDFAEAVASSDGAMRRRPGSGSGSGGTPGLVPATGARDRDPLDTLESGARDGRRDRDGSCCTSRRGAGPARPADAGTPRAASSGNRGRSGSRRGRGTEYDRRASIATDAACRNRSASSRRRRTPSRAEGRRSRRTPRLDAAGQVVPVGDEDAAAHRRDALAPTQAVEARVAERSARPRVLRRARGTARRRRSGTRRRRARSAPARSALRAARRGPRGRCRAPGSDRAARGHRDRGRASRGRRRTGGS